MKKSIIFMAGLVGLALTACDDDNSLGTMQKNEAPVIVPAKGVALQGLYSTTGSNPVSLQANREAGSIALLDIELNSSFAEESTVTGQVEIAADPDFTTVQTIPLSAVAASSANPEASRAAGGDTRSLKGVVSVLEWNEAFQSFYGLNPAAEPNYLRYSLRLNNGKQNVILYDPNGNEWFDDMEFMVTPIDAELDVEASYTLCYQVNGGETTEVAMYHNPEKHVYDDPNFSATVTVGEGESINWWIKGQSGSTFGVAGDQDAMSGDLAALDGASKGQLSEEGPYRIDVNMLDLTYTVKLAPNSLYVWYTSSNPKITSFDDVSQLSTTDFEVYSGMAGLYSNWCLTGQANYKPTLYVNDSSVEVTADGNTNAGAMMFSSEGVQAYADSPIPRGTHSGLFYITANFTNLKYTTYYCSTIGIVGSFTGWADGGDIALKTTRSSQSLVWTGEITLAVDDEWKIRANGDWAVNFGTPGDGSFATDGTPIELTMGSNNFKATEAGTYNVTINFKRQYVNGAMTPYTMTLTPKE